MESVCVILDIHHYGILVTLGGYSLDVERRAQRHEEALSLRLFVGVLNVLTVLCC